jgi:hypothetical protein
MALVVFLQLEGSSRSWAGAAAIVEGAGRNEARIRQRHLAIVTGESMKLRALDGPARHVRPGLPG